MTHWAKYVLSSILLLQAILYYSVADEGVTPSTRPWSDFPVQIEEWTMERAFEMEHEIWAQLQPDDYLHRTYQDLRGNSIDLLVLYYGTQRTGMLPHSPNSCLPGSGWTELSLEESRVRLNNGREISLSRYEVERRELRALVFFWFQSSVETSPSLSGAQIAAIPNLLFHSRSDLAFVRIVVTASDEDVGSADKTGIGFTRSVHGILADWIKPV